MRRGNIPSGALPVLVALGLLGCANRTIVVADAGDDVADDDTGTDDADTGGDWYDGYHHYEGYHGYHGYEGYHGYHGYEGYHGYHGYEGYHHYEGYWGEYAYFYGGYGTTTGTTGTSTGTTGTSTGTSSTSGDYIDPIPAATVPLTHTRAQLDEVPPAEPALAESAPIPAPGPEAAYGDFQAGDWNMRRRRGRRAHKKRSGEGGGAVS